MSNKPPILEPKWKPKIYNKLSIAQNNAVLRILEFLNIKECANILDLGCGDGKISAMLSKLARKGTTLGIDKSSAMITYAASNYGSKSYPNLQFQIQDAQKINFSKTYDLVFSSFALQWVKDKNIFFTKAYHALKHQGQMCVITPLGVSPELEYATEVVISNPKWSHFYKNFHTNWYFSPEANITHLIKESCFEITHLSSYMQEVRFSSLEDFEQYVLLWYPYLAPLEENLKSVFFSQVVKEYCEMMPIKEDGSVLMRIPVMAVIAVKD